MKAVVSILVAGLMVVSTLAQEAAVGSPQTDVRIVSSRFDLGGAYVGGAYIGGRGSGGSLHNLNPYDDGPPNVYKVTVTVMNEGVKLVKAIDWRVAYINIDDQTVHGQRKFRTKRRIAPGGRAILTGYAAPHLGGTASISPRAELMRVEYADGSVWQRQ